MPRTKIQQLAVIGDPISHSLSPAMQNAAINKLKAPFRYRAIRVSPKTLKAFIQSKAKKLTGFNVTIPHKEAMVGLVDRLAYEAKLIGAVNTVLNKNGEMIGFNTDGAGYLMSLHADKKFDPRGKNIVILGAGGAARALCAVLALAQAKSVTVANRTARRAEQMVGELAFRLPKSKFRACALEGPELEASLRDCQLLINTTRVGLGGSSFEEFPWTKLRRGALVSDIVYSPRMTPFLKTARKRKHPIHTGEGMLVYQGALAFEIWTGLKPDVRMMRRELLQHLKTRESRPKLSSPNKAATKRRSPKS